MRRIEARSSGRMSMVDGWIDGRTSFPERQLAGGRVTPHCERRGHAAHLQLTADATPHDNAEQSAAAAAMTDDAAAASTVAAMAAAAAAATAADATPRGAAAARAAHTTRRCTAGRLLRRISARA